MHRRCKSPNHRGYKDYGGRGIKVCEEWTDFAKFSSWAEAAGHEPGLTLERIDNDGPYSPENCRWATRKEQARNRRCNVWLTIKGERMLLTDAAKRYGLLNETIRLRIKRGESGDELVRPPYTERPNRILQHHIRRSNRAAL